MCLNTACSHANKQCNTNTCCNSLQRTQTPRGLNAHKTFQCTQLLQVVDSLELPLTWFIVIVSSKIIGHVIDDIHQFSQSSVLELWKVCCYLLETGLLCIKKVKLAFILNIHYASHSIIFKQYTYATRACHSWYMQVTLPVFFLNFILYTL